MTTTASKRGRIKKPNLFIVGAPRCGTTSLYNYLKQHPQIFFTETKEPHYFGKDLTRTGSMYNYTQEEYLALFSYARNQKIIGEASPHYLYSKSAPHEIYRFNPASKIIILLRDPVEMIYSLHSRYVYSGNETETDFMKALALEKYRLKGERLPKHIDLIEKLFYKTYVYRLADQIRSYLNIFGNENVKIILFFQFISNVREVYKNTLTFLGVDDDFLPDIEIKNTNKSTRSRIIGNILKRCAMPLGKFRAKFTSKPLGITKLLSELNSKQSRRPQLAEDIRIALQNEFTTVIDQLEEIVHRDLSVWKA